MKVHWQAADGTTLTPRTWWARLRGAWVDGWAEVHAARAERDAR